MTYIRPLSGRDSSTSGAKIFILMLPHFKRVVGLCHGANFRCRGVILNLDNSMTRIFCAVAVDAGGGCLDIFIGVGRFRILGAKV